MLLLGSVTTLSSSIFSVNPRPVHVSQDPYGALNENILGSISSIPTPCSGQASWVLKVSSASFALPSSSLDWNRTLVAPSPSRTASSTASAIRLLFSGLSTILSITISIVCFRFLFRLNSSCSSTLTISPSSLILINPSLLIREITFLCSPLRPLIIGAMMVSLVPSSWAIIWSTIVSTDWLEISLPHTGQWGIPTLAYRSLR